MKIRPLWLWLVLALAGCGPRMVRSPVWLLDEPAAYPTSSYVIGIGSAPTTGGLSDALEAASIGARAEIAQTIEVGIDHVTELVQEATTTQHRSGELSLTVEAERSSLIGYTKTSSRQVVQGIELKEKYHDEKRGVLYVLAVLNKLEAALRLEEESTELRREAQLLAENGRRFEDQGDLLNAIKLYRDAVNASLRADVVDRQLAVLDPHQGRGDRPALPSSVLAAKLTDLLLAFEFRVAVDGYPLIEDTINETLVASDYNVTTGAGSGGGGLTLWAQPNLKWDTYPALDGSGGELQVCRAYLGLKIIDGATDRIVGQVNLMANSNAPDRPQAEERTLRLLAARIADELPGALYDALSMDAR